VARDQPDFTAVLCDDPAGFVLVDVLGKMLAPAIVFQDHVGYLSRPILRAKDKTDLHDIVSSELERCRRPATLNLECGWLDKHKLDPA
jgi:hypothetical protein